jgi:hypothetical protein
MVTRHLIKTSKSIVFVITACGVDSVYFLDDKIRLQEVEN